MTFSEYREQSYFPWLDGVRALCVLGVVAAHHLDQATFGSLHGGMGVTVFFVVSGYIITTLALREERSQGSVSLSAFYVRRTMRILPNYYVVLAGVSVLMLLGPVKPQVRANYLAALPSYIFYYQDVYFVSNELNRGIGSWFGYFWSLGVEEKFYLVWPFLAFAVWAGRPRRRMAGTLALLVFFCGASAWRVAKTESEPFPFWPTLLSNYLPIVFGCLLAQLLDSERTYNRLRVLGSPWGMAASLTAFLALQFGPDASRHLGTHFLPLYSLATIMLFTSVLTRGGWLKRCLESRPLTAIGRLSYGLYLVHALGLIIGGRLIRPGAGDWRRSLPSMALCCLISLAIAYVLAIVVERPCIALGRKWSKRLIENREERQLIATVSETT